MVVNIYHIVTGNLLAKICTEESVQNATLEYAKQFLDQEFRSYSHFLDVNPVFAMGLYAVALN